MIAFPGRPPPRRRRRTAHAVDRRRARRLRAHRGRPRRVARGSRGLGLRPARPERSGQVHAAQGGERPDAGHVRDRALRRRGDPANGPARPPGPRGPVRGARGPRRLPEPDRGREPRSCTAIAAGTPRSPISRSRATPGSPSSASGAGSWPGGCRGASSRCWPWPGPCSRTRACCCSTRSRWGSPRSSWPSSTSSWRRPWRQEGITILLVEQFAQTALAIADHAGVMVNGRIVRTGSPAEVGEHLLSAYMGEVGCTRGPSRPVGAPLGDELLARPSTAAGPPRRRGPPSTACGALHFTKYWPVTLGDLRRRRQVDRRAGALCGAEARRA